MKKGLMKFTKILLLTIMVISDLMTPIKVFASEISDSNPSKGDVGINNEVVNNGNSATVSVGNVDTEGGVKVTKTVSKTDTEGRYKIDFKIEGKDVKTSTEISKPVYAVIVFDRSGSMASTETDECIRWETNRFGYTYCAEYKTDNKWESAVEGAKSFATTLLGKIPTSNIALVGFSGNNGRRDVPYNDATVLRGFANTNLDDTDFGSANGGTNLHAGLYEANKLLNDSTIPSDAYKYVVVISDGEPTFYYDSDGYTEGNGSSTNSSTYDATIGMANIIKDTTKAEVFSVGYMLPSGTVYEDKTAADILTEVATTDEDDSLVKHYVDGKPEDVANAFNNIANEISTSEAGTKAILTDNLGSAFTLTTGDTSSSYVSEEIPVITEEGTTMSFYVDIDKDSETGWHNTNAGFKLEYTNYKGEKQIIECNENPEVYWVQNTYDYVVNYYKDSFDNSNLIQSETRKAPNGTVIDESNVDRDKYLPTGYEFNTINPSSITITNNGEVKEINVLYTIKKFDYVVNYYYDNILDDTLTINKNNIPYGTKVDATTYYLDDSDIREGYTLDTVKSDNKTYTITDNGVVINIYYEKNSYGYSVNYFFNSEKGFTTNSDAIYGDKITAQSKWLSNKELEDNNKSDYFLDPSRSTENNSEITIGTDEDKNVLDIYYINTNFDNTSETISKVTDTEKVTSSNDKVSYKVIYNTSINNVREGDKVIVTITDRLPLSIIENDSELNGGVYNSSLGTITWTYTYDIDEYKSVYNINEEVSYTVKYSDYLSSNGSTLVNTASGYTTVSHEGVEDKTTDGKEDSASTEVEIKGTVNVYFKDNNGNDISSSVSLGEKLAGTDYITTPKEITGYTLDETKLPSNASGKYIEGNIDVIYYYTKNDGNITENKVTKTGPDYVNSINDVFNYKLTYKGKVEDYVGRATLTLTDKLPYSATIEKMDNRCTFDNNTITCTATYEVDGTKEINESFDIAVKYSNIDDDKVVNIVNSKLVLENNMADDDDKTETEVYKGTVIATYKDTDGNKLTGNVVTTDFGGKEYKTEEKSFYGYTLKEVTGSNREGVYIANTTIEVNYIYTKNIGDVTENEVTKTQNNIITDINSEYHYVLSYSGKIENYVGEVTLELTDTLPYNANIISIDNNKCSVIGRTITCTDVFTIDENNNVINAKFDIVLKYTNAGSEVKNTVDSKLIYGDKDITDTDEVIDKIPSGNVIAVYKDTLDNKLHENVATTDLVGKDYTTEEKEFFGYSLTEVNGDKTGIYTKEDIYVEYIYTKNAGEIEEPNTKKEGPNTIESIDGVFNYSITSSANIKDYVGNATLTVKDILPYAIDMEKSNLDNRCVYDDTTNTITCLVEYSDITEEDYTDGVYEVNEVFELDLVFVGVDSDKVINKAESIIDLNGNKKTTEDETETEVLKGNVIATYKTDTGITLHENVTTTDLAGTKYTTDEKSFFGYTLKEVNGADKEGIYQANTTLEVNYIYTKNAGEIEEPNTKKEGPNTIESIDGVFNYSITSSANIKDYVGNATLTVKDILPYAIDMEKSNLDNRCAYDATTNTITCLVEYSDITEEDYTDGVYEVNEVFELDLVFVGVDSDKVINKAESIIDLNGNKETTEDETETEVLKGNVIVTYKDTEGNNLTEEVNLGEKPAGTEYASEEKEFFGYTLTEVPNNKTGEYKPNETIYVNYVYSKNAGEIEEPNTKKEGPNTIESIDGVFNYSITSSAKIKDYVGNATLTVKDILPYAIDIEKSNLDNRCVYDDTTNTITCLVEYSNITEEDYTDGVYEVNEVFELDLVFVGIDSDKVINKAESVIDLNGNKKTTEDETDTEVLKGNVIVTYKDTLGNKLTDDVIITDLVGKDYTTEEKEFFGYSLTEVNGDKTGIYTKEDIYVEYIYTKTTGTGDIELLPPQTGVNANNLYEYLLLISMILLSLIGYKKVKETL